MTDYTGPSWAATTDVPANSSNQPSWLSEDPGAANVQTTTSEVQMTTVGDGSTSNPTTATITTTDAASNAAAARNKTWRDFWKSSFERDGRTILITIAILLAMNIPYVKWGLYPFTIFSTWIHEMCHGMAALMVGGKIDKLEIFADTSGLATSQLDSESLNRRGFITSAGYQGTAVVGMLLLMVRRTKRGPRAGAFLMALAMVVSVALFVRNAFGVVSILTLGVLLGIASWWMPSFWMRNLYVLMAVTCALNSITSIRALFGRNQEVNGNDVTSDAHAMADLKGLSAFVWALIWLCLSLLLSLTGMVFAIPGPDEVADFTLCGMCQDIGCFYICNAEGRRLWSTLFGGKKKDEENTEQNGVV